MKLTLRLLFFALALCTQYVYGGKAFNPVSDSAVTAGNSKDFSKLHSVWPSDDPRAAAARFLTGNLNNKFAILDTEYLEKQLQIMDSVYAGSVNSTKAADRIIMEKNSVIKSDGSKIVFDKDILSSDSLINTINEAFATWNAAPWHQKYSFDSFLEYLLPYRVTNEPLEYYWRKDCVERFYKDIAPSDDILKMATMVNDRIDFRITQALSGDGLQGYTFSKRTNTGKCDDRAVLAVMAMRAGGIPAAYEFIPMWGSINNGHSFCSVITPDGRAATFHSAGDNGHNEYFERKVPKIYRQVFSIQDTTVIYKYHDTDDIPPSFTDCDLVDVTAEHMVLTADLKVKLPNSRVVTANAVGRRDAIAYLAVFLANGGWVPVAYSENLGAETVFRNMGTGFSKSGAKQGSQLDENVGDGILYLPCFYHKDVTVAAADPVILSKDSSYTVKAQTDKLETVILTRKYPRLGRIVEYATQTSGGVFEGATKPDFSDAVTLCYVVGTPLSRMQKVAVDGTRQFRYVRYRKPGNRFSLAEMKFYGNAGKQLTGAMITSESFRGNADTRLVADGDQLTYFALPVIDGWIGFDFGRSEIIDSIEYCPRTDDNDISPGDTYQLFWWNGQWTSLGVQKATDCQLTFDNVPSGALLWLRDITRGREERPFLYCEGKQIWW